MIQGLGIDLIETERIGQKLLKSKGLKEKIFSVREIEWCEKMADPFQHFAARFAAKEALLKALGTGLRATLDLCELEVLNTASGAPEFNVSGKVKALMEERKINKIHLSLTHVKSMAGAVVILEQS